MFIYHSAVCNNLTVPLFLYKMGRQPPPTSSCYSRGSTWCLLSPPHWLRWWQSVAYFFCIHHIHHHLVKINKLVLWNSKKEFWEMRMTILFYMPYFPFAVIDLFLLFIRVLLFKWKVHFIASWVHKYLDGDTCVILRWWCFSDWRSENQHRGPWNLKETEPQLSINRNILSEIEFSWNSSTAI